MQKQTNYAETLLGHYSSYHNHKEIMAYSIFGLEGAFFLGLFLMGNWPPSVESFSPLALSVVFIVTWFFFHTALRFQLRNRKLAAVKVAACMEALLLQQPRKVSFLDTEPEQASRFDELLDTYLLPARNAFRTPDVDLECFDGECNIEPCSLGAIRYFELKNRLKAQKSWTGYAIPMEWITTIGSILLLVISLVRVHGQ